MRVTLVLLLINKFCAKTNKNSKKMNTENNILIAKFLGWENTRLNYYELPSDLTSDWRGEERTDDCLTFHNDWNWLMSAVEKINTLSTNNQEILHWSRNNWTIFDLLLYVSDRETVYNAVIEFIKWYNENSAEKN